jgi:hypothetical protein
MKPKLPSTYYNYTSYAGTLIAIISLFTFIFLALIGYFFGESNSYLGLFTYIIIPAFLLLGLILIPIGMLIRMKRRKKTGHGTEDKRWPVLDLNVARYQNAFAIFGIGTLALMLLTGIGSYEAYHYTESVEFCGTLCHEVMEPEYTAYQSSPHARVACVDCHVGTGTDWFVRSKLSGVRQVFAVLTDDFSRPIETPIQNLRPAREICEECHWPEKFYSRQLRNSVHYLADSVNTQWNISMQMKIGPEHSAYGLSEGIHWHINPDIKIEYIPKRDNRLSIPWIRYTNMKTGEVKLYQDVESPLKEEKLAEAEPREMDCMDCHNRPSHDYKTPQEFIDERMTNGTIPYDLPFIKRIAMDLFLYPYEYTDSAVHRINNYPKEYYAEHMPEILETRADDVDKAIAGILDGFRNNMFPRMGVSWDEYPNHIGHKTYDGCFRCHDDNHATADGEVIRKDCKICHTIVLQGQPGQEQFATLADNMDFVHPKELKSGWDEGLCSECHRYLYE